MTLQKHMWFWAATMGLLIAFLWVFNDILSPFVLGAGITYLLEPVTKLLIKAGLPRWFAGLTILLVFFIFVMAFFVLIAPFAYREILELIDMFPTYLEQMWDLVEPYTLSLQQQFGQDGVFEYQEALKENVGQALQVSGNLIAGIISGGQALASLVSLCIFTPIVSFFMIKEWANVTSWIDNQLPRKNADSIRDLLRQIDLKIAGFVRGRLIVAFTLGVIYAAALTIAGLNSGILIGMLAGLLSIIPLVGSTVGLVISVAVAWLQSGELSYVGIIGAIFMVGQFVEGSFLTPKLLGKSVGMNPLWILFALLAGGSLLGVTGMLLAVPVAASIGVLIGFAIEQYRKSPYYDLKPKAKKKTKPKTVKTSKKAAKAST